MDSTFTFIDVEASGLDHKSYPIQIGWADNLGIVDEFLINPNTAKDWNYWDSYAETNVHGISRERCESDGLSVYDAATRLNSQLSGLYVISDAIDYDQKWVDQLFKEAGVIRTFEMIDVRDVIFSLRENPRDFFNERKARKVHHTAVEDCLRNLHSGAACGFWELDIEFTNVFGGIQILSSA
ncbi:conserved hypothetical protein [Vibrio chagasii]|nr:conserved hypothetical protein [Vibrio chagasii]